MLADAHAFSPMDFYFQIYSTAFPCNIEMEQCWVTELYAIPAGFAADTNSVRVTLYCRLPWTPELPRTYTGFGPARRIGHTKAIGVNGYDGLGCHYGILLDEHHRSTPCVHVEFDEFGRILSMQEHNGRDEEAIGTHVVHAALNQLAPIKPNIVFGSLEACKIERSTRLCIYHYSISLDFL